MALDLSALEEAPSPAVSEATGEPLKLKLADIDPDPNQPRKTFTPEKMAEMVASIKEHGVIQPISVRPNPDKPGRWLLNFGERRYRGSLELGLDDIPAVVGECGDYGQVIENLQREDLKAMELAQFIHRKMQEGDKKAVIARRLGVDASVVTNHLALIAAPGCIEAVYTSGRCTSAKTLYDLRSLHAKFPEQVEAWCETAEDITRTTVSALADELKGKTKPAAAKPNGAGESSENSNASGENLGRVQGSAGESGAGDGQGDSQKPANAGRKANGDGRSTESDAGARSANGADEERDLGELTSWPRGKAVSDPDLMKKPLLLVEFEGRSAAVLLNRKPTTPGLIRIRYEDGGGDGEVAASDCKINLLTEAER
ncbi:ParB/RepB/Spo0J family partition protein [Rhizobium sp. TRM95111]|uniref:ParB/RepB/Spo0J family partition protein n=1 Tax=Rhizobium alarense TaxID=2846851 RepID=UPI001F194E7D|nr:ParB/RepB/Spo0J family partition protein [Rhizobium alarense]MCF3643227.1 ParB/RepB/Spo0J family partition protein [Rhizobium alarense]